MRADRLLSLMWMLTVGEPSLAAELARRLEVSTRTILRDVEALSAAGVPVYCQRGRAGGVTLLSDARRSIGGLSEDESRAVFATLAVQGARDLGLGAALDSARRKIMAALPDSRRAATRDLADRIIIDTGGWLPTMDPSHLAQLQRAVLSDLRVRLRYQGRGQVAPVARTVNPYGLVSSAGTWYLAAAHRDQTRFYRVHRMSEVTVLDQEFLRPPGLDLREVWDAARAEFRTRFTPVDVRVQVRASRLADLRGSVVPAAGETWPEPPTRKPPNTDPDAASGTEDANYQWVTVRLRFTDPSHATAVLSGFGGDARVLDPPEIRHTIMAAARATLAAYAEL